VYIFRPNNQLLFVEHVAASFEQYKERSKHQWSLDLSLLCEEPYNLEIDASLKRKFKRKTFKKKRKRAKKKSSS
jgi:hypothetical protein